MTKPKPPGRWSAKFKSQVGKWAFTYLTSSITDEQWERFKLEVENMRTLKHVYGEAIVKQLKTNLTLHKMFSTF